MTDTARTNTNAADVIAEAVRNCPSLPSLRLGPRVGRLLARHVLVRLADAGLEVRPADFTVPDTLATLEEGTS